MDKKILTRKYQSELHEIAGTMGSMSKLARIIYTERNEHDCTIEMDRFVETFYKQLKREKTNPDLLKGYLDTIKKDPDYQKITGMFPSYVPHDGFENIHNDMQQISQEIHEYISGKEKNDLT